MKNKFSLSFGLSLIIVGILNIFLKTTNVILFGISLSTFVFSIINIFLTDDTEESNLDLLYIIPFVILLSVCCYGNELIKINFIHNIIKGNLLNVLTFISFGFLFISEYFNYQANRLREQIRMLSIIGETYDYTTLIIELTNDYRERLIKKEIVYDKETKRFIEELDNLCDEKYKKAKIEFDLLNLRKDKFSIEDFDKIYIENTKNLIKNKKRKKKNRAN